MITTSRERAIRLKVKFKVEATKIKRSRFNKNI